MNRRLYLKKSCLLLLSGFLPSFNPPAAAQVITVNGPIPSTDLGISLIHEHVLVDFSGAESYKPEKWADEKVIRKMLPYLQDLKKAGCKTVFECTPAYLGRDVKLLQKLSQLSGLQIITNTGYYGAVDNKFFPGSAQALNADEIAQIWINEFEEGIDGSKIKPGFIKISVNPGPVSPLHQKLVQAAAIAHLHTGLTIASHTGLALPAFEEIKILKQAGVNPSAFIWVHAQSEPDKGMYLKAAKEGAWISLDGLSDETVGEYLTMLIALKKEGYLSKVLISHDAGYYDPNKEEGGSIRRYTTLFDKLLPALGQEGFTKDDITQLLVKNPAEAFTLRIRKL